MNRLGKDIVQHLEQQDFIKENDNFIPMEKRGKIPNELWLNYPF
jgi:hypothetical protein